MVSLDLAARRAVIGSLCYYALDEAVDSDADFDRYCQMCADRWDELTPQRKFVLRSAEQIRTSGYHVRVSMAALMGAVNLLERTGRVDWSEKRIVYTKEPTYSKTVGRWWPCAAFQWGPPISDKRKSTI